jgi:hypothetical protein
MRERLGGKWRWSLNLSVRRGGWCSIEPSGVFEVELWKNIRKGWGEFSYHTKFEVGDGSKIRL